MTGRQTPEVVVRLAQMTMPALPESKSSISRGVLIMQTSESAGGPHALSLPRLSYLSGF